jgi:hypothetical protein
MGGCSGVWCRPSGVHLQVVDGFRPSLSLEVLSGYSCSMSKDPATTSQVEYHRPPAPSPSLFVQIDLDWRNKEIRNTKSLSLSLLLKRMKVRQFHRFTSRDFTPHLRSASVCLHPTGPPPVRPPSTPVRPPPPPTTHSNFAPALCPS